MNSDMPERQSVKWYFRTSTLVVAILSVGPLALPLLWFNPRYRRKQKLIWTFVVSVLTVFLIKMSYDTYKHFMNVYRELINN